MFKCQNPINLVQKVEKKESCQSPTIPSLQAVVEILWYEQRSYLWSVASYKPYSFIELSGNMTDDEVGLIFAQLVDYNKLKGECKTNKLLHQIIQADKLILPGGIQASMANQVISPGCCCGLEMWRDWLRFLKTNVSPWMGHDPNPWIEKIGNVVRVWSNSKAQAFYIDFEISKFIAELDKVQQDLSNFLLKIEEWASKIGFSEPNKLSQKFDSSFNVSCYPRFLPRR